MGGVSKLKFVCTECRKTETHESDFMKHLQDAHSSQLVHWCNDCGFCFEYPKQLVSHIKKQSCLNNKMRFKCPILKCKYGTTSGQELIKHIKSSHRGTNLFISCSNCNKLFTVPHCYVLHVQNECKDNKSNDESDDGDDDKTDDSEIVRSNKFKCAYCSYSSGKNNVEFHCKEIHSDMPLRIKRENAIRSKNIVHGGKNKCTEPEKGERRSKESNKDKSASKKKEYVNVHSESAKDEKDVTSDIRNEENSSKLTNKMLCETIPNKPLSLKFINMNEGVPIKSVKEDKKCTANTQLQIEENGANLKCDLIENESRVVTKPLRSSNRVSTEKLHISKESKANSDSPLESNSHKTVSEMKHRDHCERSLDNSSSGINHLEKEEKLSTVIKHNIGDSLQMNLIKEKGNNAIQLSNKAVKDSDSDQYSNNIRKSSSKNKVSKIKYGLKNGTKSASLKFQQNTCTVSKQNTFIEHSKNFKYECGYCCLKADTFQDIKRHTKEVHGDESEIQCDFFPDLSYDYSDHTDLYKCYQCKEGPYVLEYLISHWQTEHNKIRPFRVRIHCETDGTTTSTLKCCHCSAESYDLDLMKKHCETVHPSLPAVYTKSRTKGEVLKQTSLKSFLGEKTAGYKKVKHSNLVAANEIKCSGVENSSPNSSRNQEIYYVISSSSEDEACSQPKESSKEVFSCNKCFFKFDTCEEMKQHYFIIHSVYPCTYCNATCECYFLLQNHHNWHHPDELLVLNKKY